MKYDKIVRFLSCQIKAGEAVGYERYTIENLKEIFKKRCFGSDGQISLSNSNGVYLLNINNPKKKNAMNAKMIADLSDAIDQIDCTKGCCLIIKGEGNTFCSGADLSTAKEYLHDANSKIGMCALMQDNLTRIRKLPLISVACIDGYAIGGGAEITTSCDFRIMSENATIHFIHSKLGLCPGWGGASRLCSILGRNKALKIMGGAQKLSAFSAYELGYIETISKSDESYQDGLRLCDTFISNSWDSVRAIKTMISSYSDDHQIDTSLLAKEREIFGTLWGSKSHLSLVSNNKIMNKN